MARALAGRRKRRGGGAGGGRGLGGAGGGGGGGSGGGGGVGGVGGGARAARRPVALGDLVHRLEVVARDDRVADVALLVLLLVLHLDRAEVDGERVGRQGA